MWLLVVFAIGLIAALTRYAAQDRRVFAAPHDSERFAWAQLRRRQRIERSRSGYSLGVC
jgi:hypothetical protein